MGQNSENKAQGRADGVTKGQNSVEGRAELEAMAYKLLFTFTHFPLILFCMKARFLLGRSNLKSVGAASQWRGLRPKMGRSQDVKIFPDTL